MFDPKGSLQIITDKDVGKDITVKGSAPHDSALTHVTGRSEYVDDRPMLRASFFAALFTARLPGHGLSNWIPRRR